MYARPSYAQRARQKALDPVEPPTNQGLFAEPVMSVTGEITTTEDGDIVMAVVSYSAPVNIGGTESIPIL